ncbi:hypothetical protein [Okeania sp. KiyG1]|nr:hypothetical protein [Okeania sp. KiyG1]
MDGFEEGRRKKEEGRRRKLLVVDCFILNVAIDVGWVEGPLA